MPEFLNQQFAVLTTSELQDAIRGVINEALKFKRSVSSSGKQYLTKKELAQEIGFSVRQIDTLRSKGEIPWIKQGRRVLFRRVDIDAWLEKGLVGGVK